MGQLNFAKNFNLTPSAAFNATNYSVYYFPFQIYESISLDYFNFMAQYVAGGNLHTQTVSVGLYSLNVSTLTLVNSCSISRAFGLGDTVIVYESASSFSSTQNITPGLWFLGFLGSRQAGVTAGYNLIGGSTVNPANAFPGAFIGGRRTNSTTALPTAESTSNLDITGSDAIFSPQIIISA